MNTISTIGRTMATDGQTVYSSFSASKSAPKVEMETPMPTTAAEVLQNMEQSKGTSETVRHGYRTQITFQCK